MKTFRIVTIALALLVVAGVAASRPASAGVSFDFFFSNLSHHGSWMVSGSYGRVWQPAVYRSGWNPYYDGHWTYTDAGWCWDSDYAWGDIPYHYGTWVQDAAYGWVWVPGYTYAPSWVEFRQGPDYIGWAPVAPSFSIGVSFHAGFPLPSSFVFVHSHDFLCDHVSGYAIPHSQVNVLVNRTNIINNNIRIENNIVVNRGPDVRYVERATRRRIDAIPIDRSPSMRRLDARGISRQDIRVNDRSGRGLRAAEPVSASRPLPSEGDNGRDRFDRGRTDSRGPSTDRFDRGRTDSRGPSADRFDRGRTDTRGPSSDQLDRGRTDWRGPSTDRFDRGRTDSRGPSTDRFDRGRTDARGPSSDQFDRGRTDTRGPSSDRFDRGRTDARGPSSDQFDRSAPDQRMDRPDRREAPDRSSMPRAGRPDEGRMFRGVRERQPAPHADRSAPSRARTSERSQPRSTTRPRGSDGSRSSGGHSKHKDHDHN